MRCKQRSTLFIISLIIFSTNLYAQLNWENIPLPYGGKVEALCENQIGLFAGTPTGLYRSTNQGDNWTRTSSETYFGYESRLFVHSSGKIFHSAGGHYSMFTSDGELILQDGEFDANSFTEDAEGNIYCITQFDGLFVSADTGATWNYISLNEVYGFKLIMIDADGTIFLAGREKLASSTDDGLTWNEIEYRGNNPVDFVTESSGTTYLFFEYENKLLVKTLNGEWENKTHNIPDPYPFCSATINGNDEIIVSAGYDGVWKSNDFCESWEQLGDIGYNHNDVIVSSSGNLFVGTTYKGVYEFNTSTNEWAEKCNGMPASVSRFTITPNGNYMLSTGAYLFTSSDEGQNWIKREDLYYTNRFYLDRSTSIYYCSQYPDVLKSSDDGVTWSECNFNRPDDHFSQFTISPDGIFYMNYEGIVYRSLDKGINWTIILDEFEYDNYRFYCGNNGHVVLVKTKTIRRSLDYGETWTTIYPDKFRLPDTNDGLINYARIAPWGNLYFVEGARLYSLTSNNHWEIIYDIEPENEMSHYSIYDILFTVNNEIIINSHGKLLQSKDLGKTWEVLEETYPIGGAQISVYNDQIYIIGSRSVRRADFFSETVEIPIESYLTNNYPNPFNNQTTIEFFVNKPGEVKLTVYNSIGEVVDEIVNSYAGSGIYNITWNAGSHASGVYFVQLISNGFANVRKMILLK